MRRAVAVDDLVSATKAASLVGLSHHNSVTTYFRRYPDFPEPTVNKSNGRIRLRDCRLILTWVRLRKVGTG